MVGSNAHNLDTAHQSSRYKKYVEAGSWKCEESPTGAHHWREISPEERGSYICIHCQDVKIFPMSFEEAIGIGKKRRQLFVPKFEW